MADHPKFIMLEVINGVKKTVLIYEDTADAAIADAVERATGLWWNFVIYKIAGCEWDCSEESIGGVKPQDIKSVAVGVSING